MSYIARTGGAATPAIFGIVALLFAGCRGTHEAGVRAELDRASRELAARSTSAMGGTLEEQLAFAIERSPELRAAFERWRAGVHRIAPARRLPEPMLEVGVFVWDSEDGAGVAAASAGIRQDIPWPTRLSAEADAAAAEALALGRRFEALVLDLRGRVAEAHYGLWLVRRVRTIEREQLEVLRGLAESALGGVATGTRSLADQQQIQLALSRLEDDVAALGEQEVILEATLRALLTASPGERIGTHAEPPPPALPEDDEETLREVAKGHPLVESFTLRGEAAEALAKSQRAGRLPSFAVGLEWMRMPGSMGTSAIAPSLGVRLPIYQGSYREAARAAEAEALAQRADSSAAALTLYAELEEAMAKVRDTHRRVELGERVLRPQAEAAYGSVLGAFRVGRSSVAASLLAQRELLEIRVGLEQARAEHAMAWARLERAVGRKLARRAAGDPCVSGAGASACEPSADRGESVTPEEGDEPVAQAEGERHEDE